MKVNRSTSADFSSSPASWNVQKSASTKEATTVAVPSRWPQRSVRRPPSSSTAAPASGSAISSHDQPSRDRKSVVQGKSVDLGGRRIIKKNAHQNTYPRAMLLPRYAA